MHFQSTDFLKKMKDFEIIKETDNIIIAINKKSGMKTWFLKNHHNVIERIRNEN